MPWVSEERLKELLSKANDGDLQGFIAGSVLHISHLEEKVKSQEEYIKGLERFIHTGKFIED
ncbi:hypothetical protein IAI10_16670 [Clostridium sp. 19966]|uniref:hypothetical protein n=1 Tax=Clostridium sp. 19966 TaxID=2768166 RepID=UPI0028DE39E9|nr:hypothetical protein [Clostridium sp. 19966]MDT8718303.1 hypothetical protein [Clostridium sp. 19966]